MQYAKPIFPQSSSLDQVEQNIYSFFNDSDQFNRDYVLSLRDERQRNHLND